MKYCNITTYHPLEQAKVITPQITLLSKDFIINTVCLYYNIQRWQLLGNSRIREFVYPRQQAMALIREFSNTNGFKTIAKVFSKDHSSVIYSVNTVKDLCDVDKDYRSNYITLRAKILSVQSEINSDAA